MSLKKRILEQSNSKMYNNKEINVMIENTTLIIFISEILLILFLIILLALFVVSIWQIFFNGPILIEWNILSIFCSVLLGIISVLLGILSIFISQANSLEDVLDSLNDKTNKVCLECNAEIVDNEGIFCSKCGNKLK